MEPRDVDEGFGVYVDGFVVFYIRCFFFSHQKEKEKEKEKENENENEKEKERGEMER